MTMLGFPGGTYGKEPACQCRRQEALFRSPGQEDPRARKIPRRRARQPTPVFLPGHGQRSLVGYSSWGHKESDMTGAVPKSYSFKKLWPYPNLVFWMAREDIYTLGMVSQGAERFSPSVSLIHCLVLIYQIPPNRKLSRLSLQKEY